MKAVILAAGRGRRLGALTERGPKALIEVAGQPIVWRVIDGLAEAGVNEIVVVTSGYSLGRGYVWSGVKFEEVIQTPPLRGYIWSGVKFEEVIQAAPLGTADALRQVVGMSEPFLLLGCDALFAVAHIQAMMAQTAEIGLSVRAGAEVHHSTITYYQGGKIAGIAEKPTFPTSTTESLLFYKLPPRIFDYLPRVRKSRWGEYEIQDAINMMIGDMMIGEGTGVVEVVCEDYFHLTEAGDIDKFKPLGDRVKEI